MSCAAVVPDGGAVQKGELLYRLETEKVNLDVDAEVSGTVRHLVGEGITGEPGDVVGYIYAAGEVIPERLSDTGVVPETATMTLVPPGGQTVSANESANANARLTRTAAGESGRLLSSPAARRLAAELKVNISGLAGSGPGGRIVEADVKAAAAASADQPAPLTSPIARKLARGLGVAEVPCYIGEFNDALVRISETHPFRFAEAWLLYHPQLRNLRRVHSLVDHLIRVFERLTPAFEGTLKPAERPTGLC